MVQVQVTIVSNQLQLRSVALGFVTGHYAGNCTAVNQFWPSRLTNNYNFATCQTCSGYGVSNIQFSYANIVDPTLSPTLMPSMAPTLRTVYEYGVASIYSYQSVIPLCGTAPSGTTAAFTGLLGVWQINSGAGYLRLGYLTSTGWQ
eukprot:gene46758-58303_t